jgi:hypothetical protein
MGGEPPRGSPNGRSPRGGMFDQCPLGGLPPDPLLGFYGLPTLDSRIFMPPWYPSIVGQFEPTSKLPYQKFQYPTYVKHNNPNAHIRVFKKKIKANGQTMETNIINLFGFTSQDNILEWGKNFVQDHPNCTFEELEQGFCKCF